MITSQELKSLVLRSQLQGLELLNKKSLYFAKKRLAAVKNVHLILNQGQVLKLAIKRENLKRKQFHFCKTTSRKNSNARRKNSGTKCPYIRFTQENTARCCSETFS